MHRNLLFILLSGVAVAGEDKLQECRDLGDYLRAMKYIGT
jgi:hypothetical protein